MAQVCAICGKKKVTGCRISHSNIKTKRSWRPNVHKVSVLYKGAPQRINVCTRCLKSGKVHRAL